METCVISEGEALELVAFLVSAARLLPEEPTDYGPARLISAVQRICAFAAPRSDADTKQLFEYLISAIPPKYRTRNSDPDGFQTFLDDSIERIAKVLGRREGREI